MNPSAGGWINKHFPHLQQNVLDQYFSEESFYQQLQQTGFIYAHSTKTLSYPNPLKIKWTIEELSKINLFDALAYIYFSEVKNANKPDFTKEVIQFYELLEKESIWKIKISIFQHFTNKSVKVPGKMSHPEHSSTPLGNILFFIMAEVK